MLDLTENKWGTSQNIVDFNDNFEFLLVLPVSAKQKLSVSASFCAL